MINGTTRPAEPLLTDEGEEASPRTALPLSNGQENHIHNHINQVGSGSLSDLQLSLSVQDADGHVLTILEEEQAVDEVELPPMRTYCSYIKYVWMFGKWSLVILIANIIVFVRAMKNNYFDYNGMVPFDDLSIGLPMGIVWFVSAIWAFLSAKQVECDIDILTSLGAYEQPADLDDDDEEGGGNGDDSNIDNSNNTTPSSLPALRPFHYQNIHGQVSQLMDNYFDPKNNGVSRASVGRPDPSSNNGSNSNSSGRALPTSSLVNFSFAMWSVFLGGSATMIIGTSLGTKYVEECSALAAKKINDESSPTSRYNTTNMTDTAALAKFPMDVQHWITEKKDSFKYPREYRVYFDYTDEYYSGVVAADDDDDAINNNDDKSENSGYNFPMSHGAELGTQARYTDGTILFSGQLPPSYGPNQGGKNDMVEDNTLALIEITPNNGFIYHENIVNPRMFIPIESSIDQSKDPQIASKYCFMSRKSHDSNDPDKKINMNVRNKHHTTRIYCRGTELNYVDIHWGDASQIYDTRFVSASFGNVLLLEHLGRRDTYDYQQVIQLNPDTMEFKTIRHVVSNARNDNYWYRNSERIERRERSGCVQEHVIRWSGVGALAIAVLSSIWLLLREGSPAGITSIMYGIALLIMVYTPDEQLRVMILSLGTLCLHLIVGFHHRLGKYLPSWLNSRGIWVWGLYSYILAFVFYGWLNEIGDELIWASVYFGLSGLWLGHPMVQVMGWVCVMIAVIIVPMAPFMISRRYFWGDLFDAILFPLMSLVLGSGMIAFGNFFSCRRKYIAACFRPLGRGIGACCSKLSKACFRSTTSGASGSANPST